MFHKKAIDSEIREDMLRALLTIIENQEIIMADFTAMKAAAEALEAKVDALMAKIAAIPAPIDDQPAVDAVTAQLVTLAAKIPA